MFTPTTISHAFLTTSLQLPDLPNKNRSTSKSQKMSAFAPDDGDTHDPFVEDPSTSTPLPQSSSLHSIHDPDASQRRSNNPLLGPDNLVSDLEQEVLDEYTRLLGNVNQVSELI